MDFQEKEFDGSYAFLRRINLLDSLQAMVLRLIPQIILTMEQLLPSVLQEMAATQGRIFVTGPTGSGKSTHRSNDRLDQSQRNLPHPHD